MYKHILFFFIVFMPLACSAPHEYKAYVESSNGVILTLADGQKVALVGVAIPGSGSANYRKEMSDNLKEMVEGKNVMVKTVVKKNVGGYPELDLVELFIDGKNVNEELLKQGQAFFSEDYWDKKRKEAYKVLERDAKTKKIGVWQYDDVKAIYSRHRKWQYVHDPSCPKIQSVKTRDRIDYYTDLPIFTRSVMPDTTCEHCTNIWLRKMGEADRREINKLTKTGWDELSERKSSSKNGAVLSNQ